MTDSQEAIIKLCQANGGNLTKKQVVDAFGHWYYANAAFHIGNMISRMVNAGLLIRVKNGVFKLGKGNNPNKNQIILEL
jgi:hypothetical protein